MNILIIYKLHWSVGNNHEKRKISCFPNRFGFEDSAYECFYKCKYRKYFHTYVSFSNDLTSRKQRIFLNAKIFAVADNQYFSYFVVVVSYRSLESTFTSSYFCQEVCIEVPIGRIIFSVIGFRASKYFRAVR